jgi:hypothetical protein
MSAEEDQYTQHAARLDSTRSPNKC